VQILLYSETWGKSQILIYEILLLNAVSEVLPGRTLALHGKSCTYEAPAQRLLPEFLHEELKRPTPVPCLLCLKFPSWVCYITFDKTNKLIPNVLSGMIF